MKIYKWLVMLKLFRNPISYNILVVLTQTNQIIFSMNYQIRKSQKFDKLDWQ